MVHNGALVGIDGGGNPGVVERIGLAEAAGERGVESTGKSAPPPWSTSRSFTVIVSPGPVP